MTFKARTIRRCLFAVSFLYILSIACAVVASLVVNGFPKRWRACLKGSGSLVLRNVALRRCVVDCSGRGNCVALNYWPVRRECEILKPESAFTIDSTRKKCVHIERQDLPVAENCPPCPNIMMYNKQSRNCTFNECGKLTDVVNSSLRGNVRRIGAKVKVICNEGFRSSLNNPTMTCLADGTWSQAYTCIDACPYGWVFSRSSCYKVIDDHTWMAAKTCGLEAISQTGVNYTGRMVNLQSLQSGALVNRMTHSPNDA